MDPLRKNDFKRMRKQKFRKEAHKNHFINYN